MKDVIRFKRIRIYDGHGDAEAFYLKSRTCFHSTEARRDSIKVILSLKLQILCSAHFADFNILSANKGIRKSKRIFKSGFY